MIDKVRLNNYHRYPPVSGKKSAAGEFSLPGEPGEKGVIYEPSQKTPKAPPPEPIKDTVNISISAEKEAAPASPPSFLSTLTSAAKKAVAAVRNFFYTLWNGPEEKTEAELSEVPPAEAVSAPADTTETDPLQEILKSRDKEQLVRYLTEDGRRPPARSTDLLTSYDRSGRIVAIDPSDRQLILKGTFGDIKL